MPQKKTIARARSARKEGKATTTQAGEFVHEQMDKLEAGKGNAKSRKQAIAIGLSEARKAGVKLKPPPKKTEARKKKS